MKLNLHKRTVCFKVFYYMSGCYLKYLDSWLISQTDDFLVQFSTFLPFLSKEFLGLEDFNKLLATQTALSTMISYDHT